MVLFIRSNYEVIMLRKVIRIDDEICDGCGLCISACKKGIMCLVNGKAVLLLDDCYDCSVDCLPACPAGAISIKNIDVMDYEEILVKQYFDQKREFALRLARAQQLLSRK